MLEISIMEQHRPNLTVEGRGGDGGQLVCFIAAFCVVMDDPWIHFVFIVMVTITLMFP